VVRTRQSPLDSAPRTWPSIYLVGEMLRLRRKQSKSWKATPLKCSSLASSQEPVCPVLTTPSARASFEIPRQGRTMCACTTMAGFAESVLQQAWVTPAAGALMLNVSVSDAKGNKLEPFSKTLSLKTSVECLYPWSAPWTMRRAARRPTTRHRDGHGGWSPSPTLLDRCWCSHPWEEGRDWARAPVHAEAALPPPRRSP